MARYRNSSMLNKDIASENLDDGGISGQMNGAAAPVSSMPNTQGGPRMPEGFVNFDRLLGQNKDTVARKGAELDQVANGVSDEVKNAQGKLHGAGTLPQQYDFNKIMELSLKASQGDSDSQNALSAAMSPQDVAENAAVTDSDAYTKGMNKLSSATTAPGQGQDNYGGGSLNYALGDATYGSKLKGEVKDLTTGMQGVKDASVARNKEIQDFNGQLATARAKMQGEGTKAFNALQGVANNPMSALQTGDPYYKAADAQNVTLGGMKDLAKYLGIDPNSIKGNDISPVTFPNTVWNKDTQSWVAPGSLNTDTKTPAEIQQQAADQAEADRQKRITPEMRKHLDRIPDSGY
jgi:hypothetical protein